MSLETKFCRKAVLVSLAFACKVDHTGTVPHNHADMTQSLALQSTKPSTVLNQKHVQHLHAALRLAYADLCCRAQGGVRNSILRTS